MIDAARIDLANEEMHRMMTSINVYEQGSATVP